MYIISKPAVTTCRRYGAAIPTRKCWYGNSYMHRDIVIHCIIKNFRGNQTLFYGNTKPPFLYMVVSGTDTQNANTLLFPKQEPKGGQIK
jgi:hypothetical protein